jgi:hypothetical protein
VRSAGALVALLVALTMMATACGGGGRLSAREYVHQASAICRHAARRVEGETRPARRAAVQAEAVADLADLRPPGSLAGFDAVWVALLKQSAAELEALAVSHRAGDRAREDEQRAAVATLTARAAELARAHGIAACPQPFASA